MKHDEKLLGNLRMSVAGYWIMGVVWGWMMLKLPGVWFYVMLGVCSILCGVGGSMIEKIHKDICEKEVIRALNERNDCGLT